jgi:hypothetical protein
MCDHTVQAVLFIHVQNERQLIAIGMPRETERTPQNRGRMGAPAQTTVARIPMDSRSTTTHSHRGRLHPHERFDLQVLATMDCDDGS